MLDSSTDPSTIEDANLSKYNPFIQATPNALKRHDPSLHVSESFNKKTMKHELFVGGQYLRKIGRAEAKMRRQSGYP